MDKNEISIAILWLNRVVNFLMNFETHFCNIKLKNPLVLASGILGTSCEILQETHLNGCGLVTMKSIGAHPRAGHNNPTVLDFGQGLINAVGLPSPGFKNMEKQWQQLAGRNFPIIASIYGASVAEFAMVASFVAAKKPEFIEVNISCPNTEKEGMLFGVNPDSSFKVVKAVKKSIGNIPLIAKLTPQALNIADIASACEDAGANALCAINTVGPGMIIDIETSKPVLSFKKGGLSGPAVKPIAVRCIYEIYKKVNLPIIGMGGVLSGEDAVEFLMAGASFIGIGSAVYYRGKSVFNKVLLEMDEWLTKHGYKNYEEIVGLAHE